MSRAPGRVGDGNKRDEVPVGAYEGEQNFHDNFRLPAMPHSQSHQMNSLPPLHGLL